MSRDWVSDINDMQTKFGFYGKVREMDPGRLFDFLNFRNSCVMEEAIELDKAAALGDSDGTVDALIDGCVFAIGTLLLFGVDPYSAWDRVHAANMNKEAGIKPERPNPFGLPDLIKPPGWTAPTHEGNLGLFPKAFLVDNVEKLEV